MSQLPKVQRCVGIDAKGDPCGKWARKGETTCLVHDPNYVPVGIVAQQQPKQRSKAPVQPPDGLSDEQLLDWVTKHGEAGERLRALELKFKWNERQSESGCATCRRNRENDETQRYLLSVMTDVERQLLDTIITEFVRLKDEILAEGRIPRKRQENAAIVQRAEPASAEAPISESSGSADTGASTGETDGLRPGQHNVTAERPTSLSDEQMLECGCYLSRGVWSSHLGDQHAAAIRSGAIPFEQARKDFLATQREGLIITKGE